MNIYLIERKDKVTWDENVDVVVAADSPKEAGAFANDACSGEGQIWGPDKRFVSYQTLTKNACKSVKAGIILISNRGS